MQKCQDSVQTTTGQAVGFALVRVQTYPGAIDAVIYSDNGVTPQTNPITTDGYGSFGFYAANGTYQLVISGPSISTRTITGVLLDDGSRELNFGSNATIAAATTIYLGVNAQQATENFTQFRMPFDGYIVGAGSYVGASPGAGQTYTYTVRVLGVDTALTYQIINGVFQNSASANVACSVGASIDLKLVTSAAATATTHSGNIMIVRA